ncbi:DNA mismatch repair protein MLH3 [Quillaja saponaria]|uniref:DNA mismatch repair protein MLH3 n=1 Tax=Quillaja saponaria TaxID=32244 RepID=A0AAD7L9J8_QUISA|nr:DNA mismatch repair protein MLH3 [Quillaja saponaria]
MRSIRPLSETLRSSVRSGILLFDLTRVVEELVFNSLDAGAETVSVFLNVGSSYVKVVDDGPGITRDGLVLVGERYATSKFPSLVDMNATNGSFGFRGEALASISDVSLLEIVTRTNGRPNGYRKVLKGCKCLYLGLDDDRKNVGTTVIVRDLFYNQPVRRKCMQSSAKKVLQSVKKCVLRLALVHPKVSFKVVDMDSEDELLSTRPSSPLSILTRAFGPEVSSSLHPLEVHDGVLRLSGYISGPCNSFAMKALQYVYINSQFVCKGPIHKLLNQMAVRFEHLDPWKADNGFQTKKRRRSQAYPAFVLNLSCPRSLYDLTFEPSKTYVEFKAWTSILNFVDKAIVQFWEEKIGHGEFMGHATYRNQADQPCNKGENKSAEADFYDAGISERGIRNHKGGLDLFSHNSDLLTKEDYHLSDSEESRTCLGHLCGNTAEFDVQQNERDFACPIGYPIQALNGSLAKCVPTVTQKNESLWMDEKGVLSEEDCLLDSKFNAAESSNNDTGGGMPSSSRGNKLVQFDGDVRNGSAGSPSLYDFHAFSDDGEVSGDIQKPFMKSCSVRRSLLHERDLFANDGLGFQSNSFWTKQKQGPEHGRGNNSSAQPYPELITKYNMSRDSDFLSRTFSEENCIISDLCLSTTELGGSGSCHQFLDSEWCSIYTDPFFQASAWDRGHFTDDELKGISRSCKRGHCMNLVDNEERECKFSYDITLRRSSQEYCNLHCTNSQIDFDRCKTFHKPLELPNPDHIYSPEVTDETSWFCLNLFGKGCQKLCEYDDKRDHFRRPPHEGMCERSRRSQSAPPFHKSRRRFYSLNHPSTLKTKEPNGQTSNHDLASQEDVELKHPQQSSSVHHQYFEPNPLGHLLIETRPIMKKMPGSMEDIELLEVENFYQSQCVKIQVTSPIKEPSSKGARDSTDYGTKWRNCFSQIPKNEELLDNQTQSNILDISSGLLHLAGESLVPETISKNCLNNAKVLHQVDKKFIPVVAGKTLAVIDQHAADERIRLEELRQKVLSGEAKTITYLDAEQELVLPEIGYQLLHNYTEQIKDWGWICNVHAQDPKSFKRNLNLLNKQPMPITLLAVPCILGVNLSNADLLEFLQQLAETDGSSTMPLSVVRILNSKACRGAIMFGDSLLPSECSLLVEELKQTSLCFQCAHGRPTTVPIVNLEALHNQIVKLGLLNDCPNGKWHGLHRHELSLERAAQRLCSARG